MMLTARFCRLRATGRTRTTITPLRAKSGMSTWACMSAGGGSLAFPVRAISVYAGPDVGFWSTPQGERRWVVALNFGAGIQMDKDLPVLPA